MRRFDLNPNIDNSNIPHYPNGRLQDDTGSGNGTAVNERVYGDIVQFFLKLVRLSKITVNNQPDNESNGFQLIEALHSFATKNSIVHDVLLSGSNIKINLPLVPLNVGEFIVCKANFDYSNQTFVIGTDLPTPVQFSATVKNSFKTNDTLYITKTSSGFEIESIANYSTFDNIATELKYPKIATQAQEDSGTDNSTATSPKTNLTAFVRRVNGSDSNNYLANSTRDGIYPKSHYTTVEALGAKVKNKGWFGNVNAGSTATLASGGDVASVSAVVPEGGTTVVTVTMTNAMNPSYIVKAFAMSEGALVDDADIYSLTPKVLTTTQFQIAISKIGNQTTAIKVYFECSRQKDICCLYPYL